MITVFEIELVQNVVLSQADIVVLGIGLAEETLADDLRREAFEVACVVPLDDGLKLLLLQLLQLIQNVILSEINHFLIK